MTGDKEYKEKSVAPSQEHPRPFDEHGECDDCGADVVVAVTPSGRYCWECIPDDDLARILVDLAR